MRAVILAGGRGTRLWPLTKTINKHVLPCGLGIGTSPMLWYPLWSLKRAGIKEILIVTDRKDAGDVVGVCGSGHEFGLDITYRFQDRNGGVAEALGLAKSYIPEGEQFLCILGDNVFTYNLKEFIEDHTTKQFDYCAIGAARVKDPLRYALIELVPDSADSDNLWGEIANIVEKPKTPISDLALTGIAMFDDYCFEIIDSMKPSARNELEYVDVLNAYNRNKKGKLALQVLPSGTWCDAGTFSGMDTASRMVADANFTPFPELPRQEL